MYLCSSGHEEVCYEVYGDCPACAVIGELEDKIRELEEQLNAQS